MTLLLYLISSSHQGVPNKICYVLNRRIISAPFPLLHHMSNQQINHAKVITTCFKMKQAQGTFFKLTSGPIVREEVYQVVFYFFFFFLTNHGVQSIWESLQGWFEASVELPLPLRQTNEPCWHKGLLKLPSHPLSQLNHQVGCCLHQMIWVQMMQLQNKPFEPKWWKVEREKVKAIFWTSGLVLSLLKFCISVWKSQKVAS